MLQDTHGTTSHSKHLGYSNTKTHWCLLWPATISWHQTFHQQQWENTWLLTVESYQLNTSHIVMTKYRGVRCSELHQNDQASFHKTRASEILLSRVKEKRLMLHPSSWTPIFQRLTWSQCQGSNKTTWFFSWDPRDRSTDTSTHNCKVSI